MQHSSRHTHKWWVMSHIWSHGTHMNDYMYIYEFIYMSHITHMKSRYTYEWLYVYINIHIYESCHTYEVTAHIWMITCIHIYLCIWVMSHIWSHGTHMNDYMYIYIFIHLSHVTHMKSRHTYECLYVYIHIYLCIWVMSHIWSHGTHMNDYMYIYIFIHLSHVTHMKSRHTYECLYVYIYIYICIYMSRVTHMKSRHKPDQINDLCSLTGQQIWRTYFTHYSVQILKILLRKIFIRIWSSAQDCAVMFLFLNIVELYERVMSRICMSHVTLFIIQHCWVVDFHLTNMIRRKCFVPVRYQPPKSKLAGLASKYFYMIHRVGRYESWVMSHVWIMGRVTHMNNGYKWVMTHKWITSHDTNRNNGSCHKKE